MDVEVHLTAVIVSVSDASPYILTLPGTRMGFEDRPALPSGPLLPEQDQSLDRALRRWVAEQTRIDVRYVEQLYTFGDRFRHPDERRDGPRVLSVAYLALVADTPRSRMGGEWIPWYDVFPWEDHREVRPEGLRLVDRELRTWGEGDPNREERVAVAFGLGDAPWDPIRALDRYELMYEAEMVSEAGAGGDLGVAMVLDHRRIAATALSRVRGKMTYRPVVFELLPEKFTLGQLQGMVEALVGATLHTQNFRRLVERNRLVQGTGESAPTGGRPAELYRFRREVIAERPRPGFGIPEVR